MISWGVSEWLLSWRFGRILVPTSVIGLLSALFILSWLQVQHWRNSISLYEHALAVTQNNYVAHNNLGTALEEDGKLQEAMIHYSEAVKIKPNYAVAHNNLGEILVQQKKFEEALPYFEKALELHPTSTNAKRGLSYAEYNLGR